MIAGVADAEAYLHERLGNYEAALALHIAHLDSTNKQLESVVLSGQLPLLQLPTWAAAVGTQNGYGTLGHSSSSSKSWSSDATDASGREYAGALCGLGAGVGELCKALLRLQQQHHHNQQQQQEAGQEGHSGKSNSSREGLHHPEQQQHDDGQQQQQEAHACGAVAAAVAGWLLQQLEGASGGASGSCAAHRNNYTRSPSGRRNTAMQQQHPKGLGHSSSSKKPGGYARLIAVGQRHSKMPKPMALKPLRTLQKSAVPGATAAGGVGVGGGGGSIADPSGAKPSHSALAASFMEQQLLGAVRLCHVGWLVSLSPHTQLKGVMDGVGGEVAAAGDAAGGGGGSGSSSRSSGLMMSPPAAAGEV